MEIRNLSMLIVTASALTLGSYACVGSDPVAPDAGDNSEAGSTTDASTNDATQTGNDSSAPPPDAATNTDAGVDAAPPQVTRVFVSSAKYLGGTMGGLAAADTDCQTLATAAGRGNGWKAWLSTSTVNAKDHIVLGDSPITLVDGITAIVAHGTDLIGDGGLEHAIDLDETATSVTPALVWTGTTEHGVLFTTNPNNSCHDWLVEDGGASAGETNQLSVEWTSAGIEACSLSYSIFCFGP
jgi:hypothetical protein